MELLLEVELEVELRIRGVERNNVCNGLPIEVEVFTT